MDKHEVEAHKGINRRKMEFRSNVISHVWPQHIVAGDDIKAAHAARKACLAYQDLSTKTTSLLHLSKISLPRLVYRDDEQENHGQALCDLIVEASVGDLLERVSDKGNYTSQEQADTVRKVKEE